MKYENQELLEKISLDIKLINQLKSDVNTQGIAHAESHADSYEYDEDIQYLDFLNRKLDYVQDCNFSASEIDQDYFLSTESNNKLLKIFEKKSKYCNDDKEGFRNFLNEVCNYFNLYREAESAFQIKIQEIIKELEEAIENEIEN